MVVLSLGDAVLAPASPAPNAGNGGQKEASMSGSAGGAPCKASESSQSSQSSRSPRGPRTEPPTAATAAPEPVPAAPPPTEKVFAVEKKAKSRHASVGARQRTREEKENVGKSQESSTVLSTQKGTPRENPEGAKIARAALLELTQAFQTGNETAALQALGQLMRNRQGLENLSGFDEKTSRYLQQTLSVMAAEPQLESLFHSLHSAVPVNAITPGVPVLPGCSTSGADRVHFPREEQRQLVAEDWRRIQQRSKKLKKPADCEPVVDDKKDKKEAPKAQLQKSSFWNLRGRNAPTSTKEPTEDEEKDLSQEVYTKAAKNASTMDFSELVVMNAGIIGGNMSFTQILLSFFEELLAPVINGQVGEAEVAADIVALRFFREAQGEVQFKEFKTSMLASSRSLLPDTWDTSHETAWIAVWDCIAEHLERALPLPRRYVKAVQHFVAGLSKEQRYQLAVKTFDRLFRESPEVSSYFKSSNTRLAFIVNKALDSAARLFDEPAQMVEEMQALGLKHIMFQAQAKFFHPWVSAMVAEIQQICQDEEVVEGMNYAMCILASIMGQAVETGSTPVLQAVANDDVKALRRALQAAPRAARFEAALGSARGLR